MPRNSFLFQMSLLPLMVDKYVSIYEATRRHIPEDSSLHSDRRHNPKSHK